MNEAELRVLEAAVESWIGLWEVVWILRPLFPGQADSQILPFAQTVVRSMSDRGQVRVAQLEHRPADDGRSEIIENVLTGHDRQETISGRDAWDPPRSTQEPYVAIAATDAGEEAYQAVLRTR